MRAVLVALVASVTAACVVEHGRPTPQAPEPPPEPARMASMLTVSADVAPLGDTKATDRGERAHDLQAGGIVQLETDREGTSGLLFELGGWRGFRPEPQAHDYTLVGGSLGFIHRWQRVQLTMLWNIILTEDDAPHGDVSVTNLPSDLWFLPRASLAIGSRAHRMEIGVAPGVTPHDRRIIWLAYRTPSFDAGVAWLGRLLPMPGDQAGTLPGAGARSIGGYGDIRVDLGETWLVARVELSLAMIGASIGIATPL